MNLPEKLAREISRVTQLREQYISLRSWPGVNVEPAIYMMEDALEKAKQAAGSPDIEGQISAVKDLEGYTD